MKKRDTINYYIILQNFVDSIFSTFKSYVRILKMSKKPTKNEYILTLKVSSIGILLIGTIGFIFYLIMDIIPKLV